MNLQNFSFEENADRAADFLRALGNQHRLQVLCLLLKHGEMNVGQINEHTTLSQSALSQHLAKMREEGMVTYRRDAQTLYYRICDEKVVRVIAVLKESFCP
ncbi:MAG: metalloregulator ArsR/SmtB family transcription factor [Neisseria sp.]|nr:metalloregulator ArsR/SmtB family transcription factor [Neisseria sp.]